MAVKRSKRLANISIYLNFFKKNKNLITNCRNFNLRFTVRYTLNHKKGRCCIAWSLPKLLPLFSSQKKITYTNGT